LERPYFWFDCTVEELNKLKADGVRTVLLPVGCVEQHGYHLTTAVDMLNAEQVSRRVAEQYDCIVLPSYPYTFSGGQLTGTINISPPVIALVLEEICRNMAQQGFKHLALIAGHAGTENWTAITEMLRLYFHRHPEHKDMIISLCPVWEFSPTWLDYFNNRDFHAAIVETSLMLYWAPEKVRKDRFVRDQGEIAQKMMDDQDYYQLVEKPIDLPHVIPHVSQREEVKVGVMGLLEGVSAELGEKVCNEMVAGIVDHLRKVDAQLG